MNIRKAYSRFLYTLKHLFIPHENNEFKPHFFREHIMLTLLIGTLTLLLISFTSYTVLRTTSFGSQVVASVIIDLTNETRREYNLKPLFPNERLEHAAKLKGEDMVNRSYFAHYAPDGTSPWFWIKEAGYRFSYAGENLAVNFTSSQEVEKAWLASQKHRENILNPNYEDIGVATIKSNHIDQPALFVVQLFGKQSRTESGEPGAHSIYQAHLYERLLFNMSHYVRFLYLTLLVVVSIALLLMIGIEFRKQHYLHIFYGVVLGSIIMLCIIINSFFL